jgi:hypothetical protein
LSLKSVLQAHLRALAEFEPFYGRLVTEAPLLPEKVRGTLLMLHAFVSGQLDAAAQREHQAGRVRAVGRVLLFNTWIGLVHHYLVNRDLFVSEGSVLSRHGEVLVEHFMSLMKA